MNIIGNKNPASTGKEFAGFFGLLSNGAFFLFFVLVMNVLLLLALAALFFDYVVEPLQDLADRSQPGK